MSLLRAATIFLAATGFCFAANLSHASSAGTLAFPATIHYEVQNTAERHLPVNRTGGSTGAAGAVCTAMSGTARLGTDFKMTTTALQWASGDATAKNCVIEVLDTTPFSGKKSFTLELTSVTGAAVGSISKETVIIWGNKGAGAVALSAASFSVAQNAGTAEVTVNRTGGSVGEAIVFYATANSTAVAGTNYTKTRGILSWGNRDSSAKTISIPISNAIPFSGTKNFVIALASPEGVLLGTQTSAIVSIKGDAGSTGTAALSWSPPTTNTNGTKVTPLKGYHIHYGKSQTAMNNSLAVAGASITSYEFTGLTKATWYFAISADAADGTEGPKSNIGSKTVD